MAKVSVGLVPLVQVRSRRLAVRSDLGDLRLLTRSIRQRGVLQPVVVERAQPGLFWIRSGHRRVAAARLAGLERVPAVIHDWPLTEMSALLMAAEEQATSQVLGIGDKRRLVLRLRDLGCSWRKIAAAFGVHPRTTAGWVCDDDENNPGLSTGGSAVTRAMRRLAAVHRDEFEQLLMEEGRQRAASEAAAAA